MSQSSTQTRWQAPIVLLLLSMVSIHSGAAIAKSLFGQVSPLGLVSLRLGLGALVMVLFAHPRWRHYAWRDYRLFGLLGLSMGVMNALFYNAIAYIPISVGVTLEFVGPLGVALIYSRRNWDLLWVALAAAGIILLAPVGGFSLHPLGALLALLAGGCWAAYIILAAQASKVAPGSEGVAIAAIFGTIVILPFGIAVEGGNLFAPSVLVPGLAVGILSSALPYALEMAALRHLSVKVFGVLMSLEPAIASCLGLLILGEKPSSRILGAIAFVSIASAGSTLKTFIDKQS